MNSTYSSPENILHRNLVHVTLLHLHLANISNNSQRGRSFHDEHEIVENSYQKSTYIHISIEKKQKKVKNISKSII